MNLNNVNLKLVLTAAASFVAGYLVANKRNEEFYFNRANEEVDALREEYEAKLDEYRNLEEADILRGAATALEAEEALATYQGVATGGFVPVDVHALAPEVAPLIQYSDYVTDEKTKKEESALSDVQVLTEKEFRENRVEEYELSTLIYYIGDDTLVSGMADNELIPDELRFQMLGNKHDLLAREGVWDPALVWYFRNPDMKYDFEMLFEAGKYADLEGSGGDG